MLLPLWLLALGFNAVRAAVCPETGQNAPDVVTLMVSKTDPVKLAWVVHPNCLVEKEPLAPNDAFISERSDIERIDSLPADAAGLILRASPLSRGADLSRADRMSDVKVSTLAGVKLRSGLVGLDISGSSLTSVAGIVLPDSISELDFSSTQLASLQGFKLPASVRTFSMAKSRLTAIDFTIPSQVYTLDLESTPLKTLEGVDFPASLTVLKLAGTKLTAIDFVMPSGLQSLEISSTAITAIDRVAFPASFHFLLCESSGLTTVRGVKWPHSLKGVRLGGNSITNFEIRRSDLGIFKAVIASSLFSGDLIQPKCADSTAQVVTFSGKQFCVITDDRFEAVYVNGNGVTPAASADSVPGLGSSDGTSTSTTTGSKSGDSSAAGMSDLSSSKDPTNPANTSLTGGKNSTTSGGADSPGESQDGTASNLPGDPSRPRSSRKPGASNSTTETETTSGSSSDTIVIGVCGGGVVLVVMVLWALLTKRRRKSINDKAEDNNGSLDAPEPSCINHTQVFSKVYLANDVRNDKALTAFRIEHRDLPKGHQIAMSKAAVWYKSTFQGKDVVVKQLTAGMWEDKRKLSHFMDEIRRCASLDHHKIVAFIGIAWTSVRDLSVVTEYMPLGDLSTLLLNQRDVPTPDDWSSPWSSSCIKGKAAIAQDVAEAVVYLHSFNNPVLHRNLKARNVLLDSDGNAKLSGFGISREASMDDTMTGEIGTAAWVAPEVLRGERYDEKADVYSLGVLLVELDRCQHPYATTVNGILQSSTAQGQRVIHPIAHNNTQIAVLVSSGKLRPSVSSECPEPVTTLAARCLSFDPTNRPTSMEVYYGLRQARRALE